MQNNVFKQTKQHRMPLTGTGKNRSLLTRLPILFSGITSLTMLSSEINQFDYIFYGIGPVNQLLSQLYVVDLVNQLNNTFFSGIGHVNQFDYTSNGIGHVNQINYTFFLE